MYNKQDDIEVLSLSTNETLKINTQISHTRITDSDGERPGPDNLLIVFSVNDPSPIEDREPASFNPSEPLVILMETPEQVDQLINALHKLRAQIWGLNLELDNNKN
jgi:hypothetical protein